MNQIRDVHNNGLIKLIKSNVLKYVEIAVPRKHHLDGAEL